MPAPAARENLMRALYAYAWASRKRRELLPLYRARAFGALRAYRVLRHEGRAP